MGWTRQGKFERHVDRVKYWNRAGDQAMYDLSLRRLAFFVCENASLITVRSGKR